MERSANGLQEEVANEGIVAKEGIVREVAGESRQRQKPKGRVGLFSLVVLLGLLGGMVQWYLLLLRYMDNHEIERWDHYHLTNVVQLNTVTTFEEVVLKYKVYLIVLSGYFEPNIILALCMLLTFWLMIASIERETSTSVIFYEYSGNHIYIQLIKLGLDAFQYLLTGRCYCLGGGAAAVWMSMLTKFVYYRLPYFMEKRGLFWLIGAVYICGAAMLMLRGRVDLVVGVGMAVVEVGLMGGGTIKYPKQVFQEKEGWAGWLGVVRWRVWHPFRWNQYRQNEFMCLNNDQLYITRRERLILIK